MTNQERIDESTLERETGFGIVVGIEGGDSIYAVAAVDFRGGQPLAYMPVKDLHPQGKFAMHTVVVAEVNFDPEDSQGYDPSIRGLHYTTDEEADSLWAN